MSGGRLRGRDFQRAPPTPSLRRPRAEGTAHESLTFAQRFFDPLLGLLAHASHLQPTGLMCSLKYDSP